MEKKGQELSLTVIIVAVIALVVLVVLVAIFTGKIGTFTKKTGTCRAAGGECVSEGACSGLFRSVDASVECIDAREVCCVGVKEDTLDTPPPEPAPLK